MLQDTFYFSDDVLLRTHTSPMQVRAMEQQEPPIYIVVPGKVYRRDSDATHTPMFHQLEGLAVDEGITLADLQGTLLEFARAFFGGDRARCACARTTSRSPSRASSSTCPASPAAARAGCATARRDPLCKGTGWIEVGGAGMVDPNVLRLRARAAATTRSSVQGFAFGLGIDRIAMLKHGVPDLRLLLRERPALPGAVLMRVPVSLADGVLRSRARTPTELATALALSGTEVERIASVGVPRGDGNARPLPDRRGAGGRARIPDADRLRVCTRAAERARTSARSCAARRTWPRARP